MATGPVSSSLLSDSWTNLAAVEGSTEHTVVSFPRSAQDIKQILELKLAILSGGRDEMGREIIVFPARPAVKYDHKQILQTLQYLSSIPSPEALELGFTVIVDGRWLSWPDIKLILRTTQEALPGAVHVAYVLQPNQFMKKKSVSLSLSKERDKLEFTIVTASSTDKLLRHIDGRQIPVELGGAINYKHNEWIALRIKLEELTAAYQLYLESFNDHESHLKSVQLGASPPGPAGGRRGGAGGGDSIQQEIESLNKLKGRVESSDEPVNRLAAEVKELIETTSGSTGMSPEVISVLGKVNKILQLTSQQQSALMDLYQEKYRLVNEKHLMKQFETGTNKVVHWIKSKGLEEAGSVDIGESLAAALLLEEKLNKLTNKVESMKEDVTELKRLADVLRDFNESITDQELKRLHKKYSKFISTYKQRQSLVTRSVCMYRGLEEWRTLYDQLTVNWTKVKNSETDIDDCEELIKSLDNDNNRLKELAEAILLNGQELVKALKDTGVSQGDPEFRRSLRYISRTTDEVTDKARRSQEIALAKYARLDQYSQILVCEKDGKESIHKLSEILDTLKGRSTVIGDSLEATQNYIMELEEHKKEVDHTREYAKGLLASAVNQRETLGGDLSPNEVLQAELKEISSELESTFALIRSLLQRLERIQTVHEGAESSIKYWGSERLFSDESSWSEIEQVLNNMEEKGGDLQTAVNICIKLGGELLQSLSADFDSESVQYVDTLHKSLIDQEIQLTSLLTTRRHELKNHQKLISVHQANEEVLLWIREQGLPHLTAYCSLRFSVSSIKETGNEFKTFKDNVNSLTASISAAAVPGDTSPLSLPLLSRVQKRSTDVDNIWKRFLIRVDNRERVLTSLDQFMNKVINLTTLMTDYVKGGSSCSPGSKREVDSSYQEVVADGRSLIALLHKSPGGTSDWDLADAVRDKLVQLESLLPRGGGGGGARKGTKPPLVSDESTHSVGVASTHSVGVAPTHSVGVASKSERVRGLLKEMEDKKKTTNNNNNNYKEPSEETNNQRTETVAVTVNRIKEKEREGEEREEEKREGGTGLKEGQSVEPLVTVSNRHTSDEEFTHLEHATDQLMQKLLNRIDGFIKNHSSCPHSVAAARSELRDHTEFLQSLNSSIAQLKRVSETLKEDTSSSVKQKVLSLVSKVDRRIDERVSVLDKRTAAFKMITELHETSESCYRLLNSFSSSVPADIGSLSLHQLKVVLESCDTSLSGLEAAAAEYAKSTRSFTSLSTSLEMNGVEARRTVRGMLRHFETKLASTVDSYQRTRKIIVISEKQKKVCYNYYH
ncbi:PREDICTED: triple functional domain protein-like [Amphimedon queenslandica]|uniref:CRAL-TRIO domain-containing protein n=2 Tax=Amphimedon queenslandica TaxID=400682 RepID=A0AAN0JRM0_AMPQE|nr:PREDICTED: triple functional domain protein-like [Amphimedon queenslandica]|eukprot:XP_019859647.1 PREDICTED: triple functional domain protein-like [Amphimedon queenslandica]